MHKYLFLIWLLAGCVFTATAQKPDTTKHSTVLKGSKDTLVATKHDSIAARSFKPKIKKTKFAIPDSTHDPHKAIMRSIMVPGWGQLYNHRWWKVPLIYGGLGSFAVAIVFNSSNYNLFLQLAKYRNQGIMPGPNDKDYAQDQIYRVYNDQQIYDANDYYRRTRDLCILGFVGFWGINVIDAYIDAKFIHSYTVDNNLSIKIRPGLLNQPAYAGNFGSSYIPAIKITFALK